MVPLQFGHIYPSYKCMCPLDPAISYVVIYLADIFAHVPKNIQNLPLQHYLSTKAEKSLSVNQ